MVEQAREGRRTGWASGPVHAENARIRVPSPSLDPRADPRQATDRQILAFIAGLAIFWVVAIVAVVVMTT